MTITSLAAMTRHAASVSRRASLRALGGAVITALAAPVAASADNTGKKIEKRCRRQREQCRTVFAEICQGAPVCEAAYFPCCEHFSRCDAGQGIECIFLVD